MVHWSKDPVNKIKVLQKISDGRKGKGIGNTYGFKKGKPSWNKGLPKEQQPRYGKPVSQKQIESCRKIGKLSINTWANREVYSRSINSKVMREEIYYLKGNKCELCGITNEEEKRLNERKLDIHHINKLYGNIRRRHKKGNLMLLCRSCHQKWHQNIKYNNPNGRTSSGDLIKIE